MAGTVRHLAQFGTTLAALAVATVGCGNRLAPPSPPPSTTAVAAPRTVDEPQPLAPTPSARRNDERSIEGARAFAVDYLELSEAVVGMDDAGAAAVQRAASSADAADDLTEDLLARLAALRLAYPAGVAYRVAPLAIHVPSLSQERATVEVWYVGVVIPPDTTAYEEWRTSRYELVWERKAWRVAAEASQAGPRPASLAQPVPASGSALTAMLDRFEAAP